MGQAQAVGSIGPEPWVKTGLPGDFQNLMASSLGWGGVPPIQNLKIKNWGGGVPPHSKEKGGVKFKIFPGGSAPRTPRWGAAAPQTPRINLAGGLRPPDVPPLHFSNMGDPHMGDSMGGVPPPKDLCPIEILGGYPPHRTTPPDASIPCSTKALHRWPRGGMGEGPPA